MKLRSRSFTSISALVLCAFSVFSASAATLIHQYEFANNLADSLGGPSLLANGGTVSAEGYTFGQVQGLSLVNWTSIADDISNYTMDISFKFTESAGNYAKIIDFKNGGSDQGLYRDGDKLSFYQGGDGIATIQLDTFYRFVLTRDSSNVVTGYLNGIQSFSFVDTDEHAVFDATDNHMRLLQDDGVTSGENGEGVINQFRIYSGAMDSTEVLALGGPKPVPEPSTALLGAFALLGFSFRRSQ